ncbi:MAG: chromate transporter [Paracoccus sp. (in: a-proteobacteria)]|uniref:chromate transporter n=1 Tax=Paracoccus sp. TaxID=267 RepID=UPI0039E2C9DF
MDRPHKAPRPAPSLARLFLTCLRIGCLSFGGGLSGWLYREFVTRTAWVGDEDFAATLTLAQIMPGANVLNLVVCLGEVLGGPRAALLCTLGFILPPVLAVVGMAVLLDHVTTAPWVDAALSGLAFAALGLLLQICWRGLMRLRRSAWQLVVMGAVVALVAGTGLSVLAVVVMLAPAAILCSARARP